MVKRATPRGLWALCAVLAALVVGGTGLLIVRLRPYWIAKYHGVGADLHDASLPHAPLRKAILQRAILKRANLRGADLTAADLTDADVRWAHLEGARLSYAILDGNLTGAHLEGAVMRGARHGWLQQAYLEHADLTGARLGTLQGAHLLRDADLTGTDLTGATYDRSTRWPQGVDPRRRGAVRADGSASVRGRGH
jgi:hypothetical protein